jgi:hypothetical protein
LGQGRSWPPAEKVFEWWGRRLIFRISKGGPRGLKPQTPSLRNQLTNEFPRISKNFQGFSKELIFEFPSHHSTTFSGKGRTWTKAVLGLWPKKCLSGLVSQEISGFSWMVGSPSLAWKTGADDLSWLPPILESLTHPNDDPSGNHHKDRPSCPWNSYADQGPRIHGYLRLPAV